MFIDETILECRAGNGGSGITSFRREKFVPKGGPDGGNGGRGGHVILKAFNQLHTLFDIENRRFAKAGNGMPGGASRKTGKCGADKILKVPVGTIIKFLDTNKVIHDMSVDGEEFIIAKGGRGGKGNVLFKNSRNQAPEKHTDGTPGVQVKVMLELKLMADCGFVGFPNVGKSSLLTILSHATPKVADYAFTTLQPYLGIVQVSSGRHFVLADIPGLIEGASQGKGLGNRFLRHIERTACLAFVLDSSMKSPWKVYQKLLKELETYSPSLLTRPRIILLNKSDLGNFKISKKFKDEDCAILQTSVITRQGLNEFKIKVYELIKSSTLRPESEW